jgi:hypothetical protein
VGLAITGRGQVIVYHHCLSSIPPRPNVSPPLHPISMSEHLFSRLADTTLDGSPSRLARIATDLLSDSRVIDDVINKIVEQCIAKERISPLFRFIEASLVVRPHSHHADGI